MEPIRYRPGLIISQYGQAAELQKRDDERSVLDLLIADLDAYPPLPPDENHALIAQAQRDFARGDRGAFDRAVAHNMRLVMAVAVRMRRERAIPLADAIQEGAIGLMRAIELFDTDAGYRFSTFANWHIAAKILRADMEQSLLIHVPVHLQDKTRKAKRLGEPLPYEEPVIAYFSQPADPHAHESEELGEHIADPEASAGEEDVIREELLVALLNRSGLTGRELAVIALRYGLGGHEPHTLLATGKRITTIIGTRRVGLSRERVRQIERTALTKLRLAASTSSQETRDALLACLEQVA